MSDVTIDFRDGTSKTFRDTPRPGGSWSQSVSYEGGVVIIKDAWGNKTAIPLDLIARVEVQSAERGRW